MVWKKVVNSDVGDSDHFGGDDLDKVSDLLGGTTVADGVDMNSNFSLRDQRLKLLNPAGTQTLTLSNPEVATAVSRTFPVVMSPYKYTIHKLGTHHYAMKYDGTILSVDTTGHPEVPIQAAIDACEADGGGDVFITGTGAAGAYLLSGSWTGFTIGNGTGGVSPDVEHVNVVCALDAYFKVPNAFAPGTPATSEGTFCKVTNAVRGCGWYGGIMYQSTPNWLWTGFDLQSDTQAGNQFNTIERAQMRNAGIGITLTNDGTDGFVNGNYIHDVLAYSCDIGVQFNQDTAYVSGQNSMSRNYFNNFIAEHSDRVNAFYGIKDVIGRGNMFMECKIWDIKQTASYHTCTITANAENTIIIGGIIRQVGWPADNLSTSTVAYDMWGGGAYYMGVPRQNDNYEDIKTMSAPASPSTGYVRVYPKAIDSNNDGLFIKRKLNGAVVEVQVG